MPFIFFCFSEKKQREYISHPTEERLKKFSRETGLTRQRIIDKAVERATKEKIERLSEILLLSYLSDENTPLFVATGTHAITVDRAGINERVRYTCTTCKETPTCLRQPYMNDGQWKKAKEEFLKRHPAPHPPQGEEDATH